MHIPKAKTLWTVGPRQDRFLINDSAHEKCGPGEQHVARDRPRLWEADWWVALHAQNHAMFPVMSHHQSGARIVVVISPLHSLARNRPTSPLVSNPLLDELPAVP